MQPARVEREDVAPLPVPVHCLIESAAGVEAAYAIASAPGVAGISLGEADLRSQTGALEAGLHWPRSRIVNAAVAAGLPRPPARLEGPARHRPERRGRALALDRAGGLDRAGFGAPGTNGRRTARGSPSPRAPRRLTSR